MDSINPVFLLPEKLQASAVETAHMFALPSRQVLDSITPTRGLNPGVDGDDLQLLIAAIVKAIKKIAPSERLHPRIAKAYAE